MTPDTPYKPIKEKWLDRSVVRGPRLCLCTTPEQYKRVMKGLKVTDCNDFPADFMEAAVKWIDGSDFLACVVCMRIDPNRSGIITASIIAHEAVHVAQRFYGRIGEDSPSKEFQAYVIENIVRNLLEEYHRQEVGNC